MKSNYNQLGQYIEMVSRTNSDLKYGIEDVRGCSNTKQMMQTRANLIGRTYEKFIVLRPQEFVFNRRTTRNGEKIGMAYNNTDREYIFTNDYVAFRVKQEYLDKLLPDYLYMFFCRDEFDRYARYKSTGSATEFFNWEDMCAVPFEIPPMDFQQLVVNAYKVLNERIETKQKINDNLEATAQAVYKKMFVTDVDNTALPEGWRIVPLESISELSAGGDKPSAYSDIQSETCNVPIFSNGIEQEGLYGFTDKAKISDESVTVSARGTVGYVFLREEPYVPIVRLIAVVPDTQFVTAKYLYFALSSIDLHSTGTSQQQITVPDFKKRQILIPDKTSLDSFMEKVVPIFDSIRENKAEIKSLAALQSNFLTLLSR